MTARLLITGGGGYLGHRLVPMAESVAAVFAPRSTGLDITDSAAVDQAVDSLRPTAIVHAAAANPGVDESEMTAMNTEATRHVASAAERVGARLVVVSTDIVHAGDAAPYADDATPNPLNTYGRTKADGETAALERCPSAAVVRTSLIWGLERMDRGTEGFAARLANGERLDLFGDVIRQPVWIDDLVSTLLSLAIDHPDVAGTLNLVGGEAMSRAEFGRLLLDWWQVPGRDNIEEIDAGSRFPTVPLDLRMRMDRARSLGISPSGVRHVLDANPNT